jgi:hypothetical protein
MAYSPAFQFYYKDFRQDPNTIRMTAEEIGVYLLLLMECWDRDNKLPNSMDLLADIGPGRGRVFHSDVGPGDCSDVSSTT